MSYFSNIDDVSQFGRKLKRREEIIIDDDGWFDRVYGTPQKINLDNDNDYTYHTTTQEEVDEMLNDIQDSIRSYEEKKKSQPDKTLSQAFVGLVKSWCDDQDVDVISDEKMFEYYPDYEDQIKEYELEMIHYKYENYKYLEEKESFEINLLKTDLKNLIEKIDLMEKRRREMINEYNDDYDEITRRQTKFKLQSEPFGSTRNENVLNLVDKKTSIHQCFTDQLTMFDKRLAKIKNQKYLLEKEINDTHTFVFDHNGKKEKQKRKLIENLPAIREFYKNIDNIKIASRDDMPIFLVYDMNHLIYNELETLPKLFLNWTSHMDSDTKKSIMQLLLSGDLKCASLFHDHYMKKKMYLIQKIIFVPSLLLVSNFKKKKIIRIQSEYVYNNFSKFSKSMYNDFINDKIKTFSYYNFLYLFEIVNYLVGELKFTFKYLVGFRNHDRSSSLNSNIIRLD